MGGYEYSNVGYAIAALMLETKTGKSWEDLMEERIQAAQDDVGGLCPPGTASKVDQPWGHQGFQREEGPDPAR